MWSVLALRAVIPDRQRHALQRITLLQAPPELLRSICDRTS